MILALESSCDETALAVVDERGLVREELCLSQMDLHKKYGGVVPELASRWHFESLDHFSDLIKTKIDREEISAVAATLGPGLVGPLLVGSSFARGLASAWKKPFVGVHHLRAHVASTLLPGEEGGSLSLTEQSKKLFPALVLLVSGGHCLLLKSGPDLELELLASTSDDAAGECFDKCAKLMGLSYPGGPAIQALSQKCEDALSVSVAQKLAERLPRPKSLEGFSFAGLKTAFRLLWEADPLAKKHPESLARALELAVSGSLISGLQRVAESHDLGRLFCCGGVAANLHLRRELKSWCQKIGWDLHLVPLRYATDNAVMVAAAAHVQASRFQVKQVFARGAL